MANRTDRISLTQQFSKRLNFVLRDRGYVIQRANGGVIINTHQLAKECSCSYQMARRYVLGEALPEIEILLKMTSWLDIPPGWLLFGESEKKTNMESSNKIVIEEALLKYVLNKSLILFPPTKNSKKIINFIFSIIYDASHLDADYKTIIKMIDLMLSAAMRFKEKKEDKRA